MKTKAALRHEIIELKAMLASTYAFASGNLKNLGTDKLMASGVLLRLHKIGQADPLISVVIRDGLSLETIALLQGDLLRSYEIAVVMKPKGGGQ